MTKLSLTLETAQTLRQESLATERALFDLYMEQVAITEAAVPYKGRWEREFARLQRLGRILTKIQYRTVRRSETVYRFYI